MNHTGVVFPSCGQGCGQLCPSVDGGTWTVETVETVGGAARSADGPSGGPGVGVQRHLSVMRNPTIMMPIPMTMFHQSMPGIG